MNPIANQDEWMMQIEPNMTEKEKKEVLADQYWVGLYFKVIKRLTKLAFISFQIFSFYETFWIVLIELSPNIVVSSIYIFIFIGCFRALYYGSTIENK